MIVCGNKSNFCKDGYFQSQGLGGRSWFLYKFTYDMWKQKYEDETIRSLKEHFDTVTKTSKALLLIYVLYNSNYITSWVTISE